MHYSRFRAPLYCNYFGRIDWRLFNITCHGFCSKRSLVPEQFLDLSKTTMPLKTKASGNKSVKKSSKGKRLSEQLEKSKKEFLYGISPCLAALEANRRTFYAIYVNEEASNIKSRPQFAKIKSLATERNIATKPVSRRRLDNLCGNRPHQNIVMKVSNLRMVPLDDDCLYSDFAARKLEKSPPPLWLVLQDVQDPMNTGAILRTSAYLGVDKVISSESDCCSLTPAVSKASAGAMESLPLYSTNIVRLLKKKRADNWDILGTVSPQFSPKEDGRPVLSCNQFRLEKPSLLVLGNEGRGLTSEVQMLCTRFLTIQSPKQQSLAQLDSLNVSVATGILLHSLLSSRSC